MKTSSIWNSFVDSSICVLPRLTTRVPASRLRSPMLSTVPWATGPRRASARMRASISLTSNGLTR
jgi:hypothetical protein